MTALLLVLGFLFLTLILAYYGISGKGWALFLTAIMLGLTVSSALHPVLLILMWIPVIALDMLALVPPLRKKLLTTPIMHAVKRVLPPLSQTEREALEAGTVCWDGELFSGVPQWKRLMDLPAPKLTPEEQAFLDGPVEQLCEMLDDWEITQNLHDLTPETWAFIKKNKFFGMIIPKRYGGLGFSAFAHSQVVMKIATRSVTAGVTVMVPNSLGPAELLMHYGTKEQQDHYLPRLATGEEVPCFALTGPKAGSDAGAIPDKGVVCMGMHNGEEVLGFRLRWTKRYITLSPVATVIGLAFKAYDPDNLLDPETRRHCHADEVVPPGADDDYAASGTDYVSTEGALGVTCALIPRDTAGVQVGARHMPIGAAFMNGPLWGEDVFIPLSYVIGGKDFIGKGWMMLMNALSVGRSISLPSLATGAGKLASLTTGAYARVREQFGVPIGYFEGVEEAMAPIAGLTYLMDSARKTTSNYVDLGEKPAVLSAILKYHNTEMMRSVMGHTMDVHAGRAVIKGPRNYIASVYKTIPISITVEGANILTRSLMIFGQGAIRCHPYLFEEMETATAGNVDGFDEAFFAHMNRNVQLVARALVHGLTGGALSETRNYEATDRFYRDINRFAAGFALIADFSLLLLGGELKRKEKLSARLGDCLSYLYLASTLLKRYQDDGRPVDDLPLVEWGMAHCMFNFQTAFYAITGNFPSRVLGWTVRKMVFPFGRTQKRPNDALEHRVVALMLEPSATRNRLVDGVYRNERPDDPTGRVEHAFLLKLKSKDEEKKVRSAIKAGEINAEVSLDELIQQVLEKDVLTPEEAQRYREAQMAADDAIKVDHFWPEEVDEFGTSETASGTERDHALV